MSRIGKQTIDVPKGVEIKINGPLVAVKGAKGSLQRRMPEGIAVVQEGSRLKLTRARDDSHSRALHGLSRVLVGNMVEGVSQGFTKRLELIGTGYRAEVAGNRISFAVGLSHPVEFDLPQGVTAAIDKQVSLTLTGVDKEILGGVAAKIRSLRPPEPYKGKGIRYLGEKVRQKEGKKGAK